MSEKKNKQPMLSAKEVEIKDDRRKPFLASNMKILYR